MEETTAVTLSSLLGLVDVTTVGAAIGAAGVLIVGYQMLLKGITIAKRVIGKA